MGDVQYLHVGYQIVNSPSPSNIDDCNVPIARLYCCEIACELDVLLDMPIAIVLTNKVRMSHSQTLIHTHGNRKSLTYHPKGLSPNQHPKGHCPT